MKSWIIGKTSIRIHNMAWLCYNVSKIRLDYFRKQTILLVIVYCMPGSLGSFIDDFISLINERSTQHRMLVVRDSNLDQMLSQHVAKVDLQSQNFNLPQRSQYSTHIQGRILDLVFDTSNSNTVSSFLSAYSDHFVLFSKSDALYLYRIQL